jgi:hypothetical protein
LKNKNYFFTLLKQNYWTCYWGNIVFFLGFIYYY